MSLPSETSMSRALETIRRLMAERNDLNTQVKLSKRTGLDQKSWSNFLRGQKPSRYSRARIKRRLGIPLEDWDLPCGDHDCEGVSLPRNNQAPLVTARNRRRSLSGTDGEGRQVDGAV